MKHLTSWGRPRKTEGEKMLDRRPRINNPRKIKSLKGQTFFEWDGRPPYWPPEEKGASKDQDRKDK